MAFRDIPIAASSNVKAVQYDPETLTLVTHFHDGSRYSYDQVPANVADGFAQASSPGKYVFSAIRGQYLHTKIG